MDFINIKIFRYKVSAWDDINESDRTDTGYVAGISLGDAASRVESIYLKPDGKSELTDIYLSEVDCFDKGVLEDCMIE